MTDYQERLAAAVADTGVTGASFAYWDGEGLHTAVAGMRNSVTGDPVTVDTVMHVGSITKIMNATLLMQLVDDGLVRLEDPVLRHLPELRIGDMSALPHITVGMLVNHTSGIDGDWLPEYGPDEERIVDTVERCAALTQLFPPGEMTAYNNVATVIAGYLTQRIRGKSWYTLVEERIYAALGLTRALVDPLDVPRFRASIGDLTDPKTGAAVQTTRPFLSPAFAPAGSTQMTTASDLVTFARAHLAGGVGVNGTRILSAESTARMKEPTAAFVEFPSSSSQIGVGWMIFPGGLISHGGAGPGVSSYLYAHPASGRVVALLTNCDKSGALIPGVLAPLLESWTGIPPRSPERRPEPVDPTPYVGVYENNMQRYEIVAGPEGLELRIGAKVDVYDNFDGSEDTVTSFSLNALADDSFEGEGARAGSRGGEIRLVHPDSRGRFEYLATGVRLLRRVEATAGRKEQS